ncbi:flagellin N-terminal helical domain-containing protein [Occallatibacter riparius]|uniref:Flagellin n=1 Tax=Occallatibacter riparius TaxID=1002689 RepID=A0A9J7BGZ0_9BACT|nr:flagellin [Occallatibacter riparius]UWZ82056.1 flagellin [Occallatibacter riparius]
MALGVLNNLSAIYAEHNLNNTNTSLQSVLQQLSSGSRINSGADDAAGLSLVNGLGANAKALTQSATNATEGVGLLQVADGALSQVTNLLNRAITLATEASNGTLNASQAAAADQEYQSILSEINNIGSTTTYNQNQVFTGSTVNIYTGDSSSTGASIDSLYFAQLSSTSMGDANGTISYGSGQSTFVDLTASGAGANAQTTDSITAGSTITFTILQANGTTVTKSVSTGGTTPYSNTVGGMIQAINNAGLGVTATFTTRAAAGVVGGTGTDTGIQISGTFVGSGTGPTAAGYHVGVDNSTGTTMKDTQAGVAQGAAQNSVNGGLSSGIATLSYTAAAGGSTSLAGTKLTTTAFAQGALSLLNAAVSSVASQDGYIGAQINTLNAISQVMSTQQENIVSAQNAIQATDYASATSAMSKYQILSQTGIAALAQANSMQQEVTKLLQ